MVSFRRKQTDPAVKAETQMVRRQFFQLLPYQVLLIVVSSLNGIIDSAFASNLIGNEAMTAIGMFGPINHFLYAVSIMMVSGSLILCGRYMAQHDDQGLYNVFSVNLIVSFLIALAIAAVMALCAGMNVANLLVSGAGEQQALKEFLLGQAIGIPGLIIGQQLFSFLSMENKTGETLLATVICILFNTVLDYLFISSLHMGTFGLALATAISEWAFMLTMVLYYARGKAMMKFAVKGLKLREVKNIIRLGYPGTVSRFSEMFRCFIINALILEYVGTVGLSSFAASNSVMAIFWSIPYGMMAVTRMLLSISIGAEDRKATEINMRVSIVWGIIVMCVVAALICTLAVPFTRLFFRDASDPVFQMTVNALRILPLCMPFSVISLLFVCYYQIMQKRAFSVILAILDGLVYVSVCSAILIPVLKMNGLYIANVLNGIFCALTVFIFAVTELKRFPRSFSDLLSMPDGFGVSRDQYMDFSVQTFEDVTHVSQTVEHFCREKGIDRRRSMFAGLAMEEMAANVVEHGFEKDNRSHSVDIRVICKDDDVILRVRDNCIPFDPADRRKVADPEDGVKNVGLKQAAENAKETPYSLGISLTYSISEEVIYNNILGLNVLIIRI